MKAYSLISCSSDYFCIGIYTSLKNCYTALKDIIYSMREEGSFYPQEEIKMWYKILEVILDNEPLECYEFSTYGKEISIDWEKVFDK